MRPDSSRSPYTIPELALCPFCGAVPTVVERPTLNGMRYQIACTNEGCGVNPRTLVGGRDTVRFFWNRRWGEAEE